MEFEENHETKFAHFEGHSEMEGGDPEKCPHLQFLKKNSPGMHSPDDNSNNQGKAKTPEDEEKDVESDVSSDEEQPRGGCPVMGVGKDKDPRLEILNSGFDIPYISPIKSLLGFKGFFAYGDMTTFSREKWDKYPNFLKHTVFYTSKDFERVRKMEIGHKLFILDKFKMKGNKCYARNKFELAITYYEKGLSILEWLSCDVTKTKDPFKDQEEGKEILRDLQGKESLDDNDIEQIRTRFKLESDAETESVRSAKKSDKDEEKVEELSDKELFDRLLLTTFCDGNITYHNCDELVEKQEIDMRNSMMLTLYMSIACCYMKLKHFSEARMIVERGMKFAPNNSIVMFRYALSIALNLESSTEDLVKAQENLQLGKEAKKSEKIFQHEQNLLRMVGLDNHEQAFNDLQKFIQNRQEEVKKIKEERIKEVVDRVKQINEIEQMIIREGKVPEEGPSIYRLFGSEDQNMEHFILNEMLKKYLDVMVFYLDSQERKNYRKAKEEYLMHKKVVEEFNFFWKFDLENRENRTLVEIAGKEHGIDFSEEKYQRRLLSCMQDKGFKIFECKSLGAVMAYDQLYFKKKEEKLVQNTANTNDSVINGEKAQTKAIKLLSGGALLAAVMICIGIGIYFTQSFRGLLV